MSCPLRKWQPGTTHERPSNTESVKELQERLAKLHKERLSQDRMWEEPIQSNPGSTVYTIDNTNKQNVRNRIEHGSK